MRAGDSSHMRESNAICVRVESSAIGRFYCAIDPNLKAVGYCAYNVYRLMKSYPKAPH